MKKKIIGKPAEIGRMRRINENMTCIQATVGRMVQWLALQDRTSADSGRRWYFHLARAGITFHVSRCGDAVDGCSETANESITLRIVHASVFLMENGVLDFNYIDGSRTRTL